MKKVEIYERRVVNLVLRAAGNARLGDQADLISVMIDASCLSREIILNRYISKECKISLIDTLNRGLIEAIYDDNSQIQLTKPFI